MKRILSKIACVILSFVMLTGVCPVSSATDSEAVNMGLGGGGAFYSCTVDPNDSNSYYLTCDMSGLFVSHNAGETWKRTEIRGVLQSVHIAEDGTLFTGGFGLYASDDKGDSVELIYPNKENYQSSVSRYGSNERLFMAKNYDSGYVNNICTAGDRVYFLTVNYLSQFRIVSCDFDGGNLQIHYTATGTGYSTFMSLKNLTAADGGLYFSDSKKVYFFDLDTNELHTVYTAEGKINDFKHIGDSFFILDDIVSGAVNETKVYKTQDFVSFTNINEGNTLATEFNCWSTDYSFTWHFSAIQGNSPDKLFLAFYSTLNQSLYGVDTLYGIMNYDGTDFHWVYDSYFMSRSTINDPNWSYGSYGPIMCLANDPSDSSHCLYVNWETCYDIRYDGTSRSVKTLHCDARGDGTYSTNGLDVLTTYSVETDPFDESHLIIASTDVGLQNSYNGGESWKRMTITGNNYAIYNTCYDACFDEAVEGRVYGLWSSRHDVPYKISTSDNTALGCFAVSEDGGNTWNMNYSTGLPSNSIPCKMSTRRLENGELMIAVATFNLGFYISYDTGKTFTAINNGVDAYNNGSTQYIWGQDIELADDCIYMMTSGYDFSDDPGVPVKVYRYTPESGSCVKINTDGIKTARTMTYNEDRGLLLSVMPNCSYKWNPELQNGNWVNEDGGIYHLDESTDTVSLLYSVEEGIFETAFSPSGTLYCTMPYGEVLVEHENSLRTLADGLFIQLKNISFSPDGYLIYITTFGGGTYKLETGERPVVHVHTAGDWIVDVKESCVQSGSRHKSCTSCGETLETEVILATGHSDSDGDGICDICRTVISESTQKCSCICHKTGFSAFIYKIVRFFWKLFGTNKVCACGNVHY